MAPRAAPLGTGRGEAAELRLRYPTSNLCGAVAGGGGRGGSAAARCDLPLPAPFLFRCGRAGSAQLPRCSGQVSRRCAVPCRSAPCRAVPRRAPGPAPQASLQAAPRGQRLVSPAAESRKRWSNLVARWQWQSASLARILMCRKGVGEESWPLCVTVLPRCPRDPSPLAAGGERCAWERRCSVCRSSFVSLPLSPRSHLDLAWGAGGA